MQDILAEAERVLTPQRLERIQAVAATRLRGLTVAFDALHDPHNVSAALRSCDAFGLQDVHLVGDTRTVPVNRGISKGCHRWLTFHWHETAAQCSDALKRQGFRVLLAMPGDASLPLQEIDFSHKTALVFGNEHEGVSTEFRQGADALYHIPMTGFVESFNVSVSVAVTLAHATGARRAAVGAKTDLAPEEAATLLETWLRRELAARQGDTGQSASGQDRQPRQRGS